MANRFCRREVLLDLPVPIVSFTFDDAPKSAFAAGGEILAAHGAHATFFVCLSLLGQVGDSGQLATQDDLLRAVENGHELGCHTFDHLDAWTTPPAIFLASIDRNEAALRAAVPSASFQTFAYPKSGPTLAVKRRLNYRFACCRGGGQAANTDIADMNLLKACFLDRRTGIDIAFAESLIRYNASRRGWLVFATHDVSDSPSPYGCSRQFLGDVVDMCARSGALLLPLARACDQVSHRSAPI